MLESKFPRPGRENAFIKKLKEMRGIFLNSSELFLTQSAERHNKENWKTLEAVSYDLIEYICIPSEYKLDSSSVYYYSIQCNDVKRIMDDLKSQAEKLECMVRAVGVFDKYEHMIDSIRNCLCRLCPEIKACFDSSHIMGCSEQECFAVACSGFHRESLPCSVMLENRSCPCPKPYHSCSTRII